MEDKKTLAELTWTASFRLTESGQILVKSALLQGDKIGAFNPFGSLLFFEKNMTVIVVNE